MFLFNWYRSPHVIDLHFLFYLHPQSLFLLNVRAHVLRPKVYFQMSYLRDISRLCRGRIPECSASAALISLQRNYCVIRTALDNSSSSLVDSARSVQMTSLVCDHQMPVLQPASRRRQTPIPSWIFCARELPTRRRGSFELRTRSSAPPTARRRASHSAPSSTRTRKAPSACGGRRRRSRPSRRVARARAGRPPSRTSVCCARFAPGSSSDTSTRRSRPAYSDRSLTRRSSGRRSPQSSASRSRSSTRSWTRSSSFSASGSSTHSTKYAYAYAQALGERVYTADYTLL